MNNNQPISSWEPFNINLQTITDSDASSFITAYPILITKIQNQWRRVKIVMLWYHNLSSCPNNAHGGVNYTLQNNYAIEAKKIADYYGIPFIDLRKCGITQINNAEDDLDSGNHPKYEGMEMYYKYIMSQLKSYYGEC